MNNSLINFFETYQTLFVGVLGFFGVIITMRANAKMQRTQHDRKIVHDANSLRVALKTELVSNMQAYELRIEQFQERSQHKEALLPNKAIDKVFNEMLAKIGLLTENEVEKILHAYGLMTDLPYRIRILVGTDNIGGYNNEFIRVKEEYHKTVLEIHEMMLPYVVEAIESIEVNLKNA